MIVVKIKKEKVQMCVIKKLKFEDYKNRSEEAHLKKKINHLKKKQYCCRYS